MILRTVGSVLLFISNWAFCLLSANAQNPNIYRTNYWYFGSNAGILFGNPIQDLSDGVINTVEGCVSISDINGVLLFYSDGVTVWNKNHLKMAPLDHILGGNSSTVNSIVAFPHPQFPNIYILITKEHLTSELTWSVIDINLENGLGKIISQNNIVAVNQSEAQSLTENCVRNNYITLSVRTKDEVFFLFTADEDSAKLSFIKNICPYSFINSGSQTTMKFSPNNNFLARNSSNGLSIYIFNDYDYELYKIADLSSQVWGLEFSPNSKIVYLTSSNSEVSKVDLSNFNVLNNNYLVEPINGVGTDIQLGLDGKLYLAYQYELNSFQNPNSYVNPDYINNLVSLSGKMNLKLPTFPSSWFSVDKYRICYSGKCPFDNYNFFISGGLPDSVLWNFGDNTPVVWGNSVSHIYAQSGVFLAQAIVYSNNQVDTITKFVFSKDNLPQNSFVTDTIICTFEEGAKLKFPEEHFTSCPSYGPGIVNGGYVYQPGTYYVIWDNGCSAPVTDTIHVICPDYYEAVIPDIFTPNQDGVNDNFSIELKGVEELRLYVYNRWGAKVFSTYITGLSGISQGINLWDGTFNGTPCTDGVYFYVADFVLTGGNTQSQKGTITLTR
ncbi:MAG: gliding motility-associated C-terminal domain-containing protein [Flavobacteriales bacterium]|nr:gliding motility-associated C-terminal domain-containing protein [Flavobacteriales bacterium]